MKCCVTTFRVRTGLGVQSITGIVDRFGATFVPEHIFLINGSSMLDTISYYLTPLFNGVSFNTNVYRASDGSAGYSATADSNVSTSKMSSTGAGASPIAALDSLKAQPGFGGDIYRKAKVIAVYDGGFDIEVVTEEFVVNTDVMIMVFGSDSNDFKMEFLGIGGPVVNTSFAAKGLINPNTYAPSVGGSAPSTSTGGWGIGFGWDSPTGGPMSANAHPGGVGQGVFKYQSHISYNNSIDRTTPALVDGSHVTAWNPTNIVVNTGPDAHSRGFVVGGTNIITASGTFIQQAAAGSQVINAGVHAMALFLVSVGSVPSTALQNSCEFCLGWSNGLNQSSFWLGETSLAVPILGANFLTASSLLRFASAGANAASTVFTTIGKLGEINRDGTFTINWTLNDGIGREILWFAIGAAPNTLPATPIPAPSGIYYINPDKAARHDSYYSSVEKKIPDPKFRSALFGE